MGVKQIRHCNYIYRITFAPPTDSIYEYAIRCTPPFHRVPSPLLILIAKTYTRHYSASSDGSQCHGG